MGLEALVPLAVIVAIFLLLVDLMHRRQRWAARYPPGPLPLPGLGNLLHVDFQNTPYCFDQLRRRFGDVFSLQLAWTPVVVLNGLAAVREAMVTRGEDTADRPPAPIYQVLGFGPRSQGKQRWRQRPRFRGPRVDSDRSPSSADRAWGPGRETEIKASEWAEDSGPGNHLHGGGVILARYGPAWREQRRFSVSTLRNLGLGKKSLEQWVTEEAACLCAAFADEAGRPFRPNGLLDKAVSNVIASLTCERRFEYDDPRFLRLLDLAQEGLKEESGFLREVLNAIPVLLHIPALAGKVLRFQKAFLTQLDELLTEHRMTWDPAQPPRDLTEAFLAEMEKAKGNPESSFNDENLRMVVADLFLAGMVTTSVTLAWGLLLMILHPDVQRRVQQEIDDVIGQVRRPEMGDQAHMPYTTAVIHEVQRFGDIVPLGVTHMTSRDIEVQGFRIPKGTTLITNLSSVLKDEAVWEKPFHFHPEHFLDAQGHFVKPEAFLPFSAGRRACLGEPLARMELFLFFTSLLQHFSFSVPTGQPRPSHHGVFAFLVTPSPYELCAVPR
ncbi:CYP2D7 isoform 7 [Pan troglodytes]|uniref:Cytochrome P450 2D6 n=2 Tax=Pan troglodytes TaxID=9598 RepID=A0A2J8LMX7_PANTR|nr:cytochrome P450 2D6 isoform X1 [Pan troglodytes]PNI48623.1 CYP2D7 isoform 7 [Pan troglodytes]